MTFTRVLSDTGLNKVELAVVYGVSRQTIFNWIDGNGPRVGSLTARRAQTTTAALLIAVERKQLPLPSLAANVRKQRVAQMAAVLRGARPAPV